MQYSVSARTSELSRGGCYVDMRSPLVAGADLEVRIIHGGQTLEVAGHVVHSAPNVGMGIAFSRTGPSQDRLLDQWLAALVPESDS
jgi:hypothetical protein